MPSPVLSRATAFLLRALSGMWSRARTRARARTPPSRVRRGRPCLFQDIMLIAGLAPLPRAGAPLRFAPRVASSPGMIDDFGRDPAWQRDSILLLAYCGLEDLLRDAATGLKPQLGFDLLQLNAEMSCAFLIAFSWVGAALLTGVLGDRRYDSGRVVLTWLLCAPAAALVRVAIYSGFVCGSQDFAAFDAAATLALQLGIRLAEEQGLV